MHFLKRGRIFSILSGFALVCGVSIIVWAGTAQVALAGDDLPAVKGLTVRWLGGDNNRAAAAAMDFSPDGKHIAVIAQSISLYDVTTGKRISVHDRVAGIGNGNTIMFSPKGSLLAWSTGFDVGVWDVTERKFIRFVKSGFNSAGPGMWAFAPDGNQIVTTSGLGEVVWWNARTGERLASSKVLVTQVTVDGNSGLIGQEVPLLLKDLTTGEISKRFVWRDENKGSLAPLFVQTNRGMTTLWLIAKVLQHLPLTLT